MMTLAIALPELAWNVDFFGRLITGRGVLGLSGVNWVYGPGSRAQTRLHPRAHLALTMIFFPVMIYLPTHLLLRTVFRPWRRDV
jgi:hypothetical protein